MAGCAAAILMGFALLSKAPAAFAQAGIWDDIQLGRPAGQWAEVAPSDFRFIGMTTLAFRCWEKGDAAIYAINFESQGMSFTQMHVAREELLRSLPETGDLDAQATHFNYKRFSWVQASGPADTIGSLEKNSGKTVVNIWAETLYKNSVIRFVLSTPVERIAVDGPQFQAFMESVAFPPQARELAPQAPGAQPRDLMIEDVEDSLKRLPPLPTEAAPGEANSSDELKRIEALLIEIKSILEEIRDK